MFGMPAAAGLAEETAMAAEATETEETAMVRGVAALAAEEAAAAT